MVYLIPDVRKVPVRRLKDDDRDNYIVIQRVVLSFPQNMEEMHTGVESVQSSEPSGDLRE